MAQCVRTRAQQHELDVTNRPLCSYRSHGGTGPRLDPGLVLRGGILLSNILRTSRLQTGKQEESNSKSFWYLNCNKVSLVCLFGFF